MYDLSFVTLKKYGWIFRFIPLYMLVGVCEGLQTECLPQEVPSEVQEKERYWSVVIVKLDFAFLFCYIEV